MSKAAGKEEDEGYFLEQALTFIEQEEHVKPQYFMRIFWYYRKLKAQDKAAEVLQKGIQYLPDYVPFHIYLGDYYKDKGIAYRALEEYKQALLLQPSIKTLT